MIAKYSSLLRRVDLFVNRALVSEMSAGSHKNLNINSARESKGLLVVGFIVPVAEWEWFFI